MVENIVPEYDYYLPTINLVDGLVAFCTRFNLEIENAPAVPMLTYSCTDILEAVDFCTIYPYADLDDY